MSDADMEPAAGTGRGQRVAARRALAASRAGEVVRFLEGKGVRVLVTGSLAGGGFHEASDIDLLVIECPRPLVYAIEADVEDRLLGLPFDVIYLDEVASPALREDLVRKAVDVRDLG